MYGWRDEVGKQGFSGMRLTGRDGRYDSESSGAETIVNNSNNSKLKILSGHLVSIKMS